MSNSITTLTEIELFEIIQRQQSETIGRQAREIVDLEAKLEATEIYSSYLYGILNKPRSMT